MNSNFAKLVRSAIGRRNYSYKPVRRPDLSTTLKRTAPQVDTNKHEFVLANQLRAKILATGPITVAEYMKEVLTNPYSGYYMKRDVFGRDGDFITSPEISQIFGELVAVWILSEWNKIGAPSPFQIVELGPGRGTLARDILKVLTKFQPGKEFSFHLVEVSPHLSKIQAQGLCFNHVLVDDGSSPYYQKGETVSGTNVFWYKRLEDVPHAFSIVVAHEFFDALPIHKLQLDNGVWKEILIDIGETKDDEFRFVISKSQTPVSQMFQPKKDEVRQCLEYSLETGQIISILADRFERDGGIGLIMDYGHSGEKSDTFRGFKKHKLHDPLKEPGTADLTADVDFDYIKRTAEEKGQVICFGPVEQGFFLKQMQGDARLQLLLENAPAENKDAILSGYKMLTDANEMGVRFKFLSMFPAVLKEHLLKYKVNGFS